MNIKLKEVRLENNQTQKEVGNILGISEYTYSHYETNYNTIPIKHLIKFCDYFKVSLDFIFDLTENKYNYSNTDINKSLVAKRLKEFRKDYNLTQEKLSQILNVSKGVIGDYERGRYLIATPFLYTICKKYNISADYLLGRVDSPKDIKS